MFRPSVDSRSSLRRPAATFHPGVLRVAVVALLLLAGAWPVLAAPAGSALSRHFEVLDLSDRVLLRPLAKDGKVPQIELPDEGDAALVAGEELDADELAAAYGEAGEAVAALVRLDATARRAALGLPPRVIEGGEKGESGESGMAIEIGEPPAPPAPPPAPGHRSSDARVSFARSITVEADERADDVVCIGCSVEVLGEVAGDAVAVGGSTRVNGKVYGDAVAVGGSVTLSDAAEVHGQAVAVGGSVHRAAGSKVYGRISQVGMGDAILRGVHHGGERDEGESWFEGFTGLVKRLIGIALLSLLVCLVLLVAPGPCEEAAERARSEPWSAGLTGLLSEMMFVPMLFLLCLVLVISIIGIPLLVLVPFLLIALLVGALVGYAGVAQSVGRWVAARFGHGGSSRYGEALLGIGAIQALSVLGDLLDFAGGVVGVFGTVVSVLGFAVRFVAWTVGFGAILLGLLAHRRRFVAPPAYVPPPPPAPAMVGVAAPHDAARAPLATTPDAANASDTAPTGGQDPGAAG